jgi:hypothetical protein
LVDDLIGNICSTEFGERIQHVLRAEYAGREMTFMSFYIPDQNVERALLLFGRR